jgi:hypothetical protein
MGYMTNNYYQILGVPRNARFGEIQDNYRRLVKKNHPDLNPHRPQDEINEKMSLINEAYGVLSNSEKRKKYDQTLPVLNKEGKINADEFLRDLMKNLGITEENSLRKDYFLIPENDYGLLSALKTAYKTEGDGEWRILRSENDKRENLPKEFYKVIKENGKIKISRSIADWREIKDRNKDIIVADGVYCKKRNMPWDTLVSEEYLFGINRYSMEDFTKFPTHLEGYIESMKSLAQKIAFEKGEIDVAKELMAIKCYVEFNPKNTKIEGVSLSPNDLDKEFVPKISFENFYKKLKDSEICVKVRDDSKAKEGQYKGSFQGGSGESLG